MLKTIFTLRPRTSKMFWLSTRNWLWWLLLIPLAYLVYLCVQRVIKSIIAYRRLCRVISKIPGWPTHWLWGNAHQIEATAAFYKKVMQERIELNRHIGRAWLGPFICGVSLSCPEMIRLMLHTSKASDVYGMIEPWLGKGLLIANGAKWYRNRRLLTPAFHYEILKPYVQVYNDCTNILLSKWEKKAARGEPVMVYQGISRLTLDVILRCAFSYNSNCQIEGQDSDYITAVYDLCNLSAARFVSPLMHNKWIFFYCTAMGWRYRKALNLVHGHSEKVIRDRKQTLNQTKNGSFPSVGAIWERAKSGLKHLDFLDVLLVAHDEFGCGLTDLEIRNEVDTFMFEGHDTTANGLMWTLYLLAKHPEHQDKCREEIRSVLQGRDRIEHDDLSKLQYTLWCIKESMRMYPPVYEVYREITEDIQTEKYLIPKEVSWVVLSIAGVHYNPDHWKNPEEFDPLRFHPENTAGRHPYAYIPFSAGPRNCIGQVFALNELRVVIGSILNRFSLSLAPGQTIEPTPLVVLRNPSDILLHLTPLDT